MYLQQHDETKFSSTVYQVCSRYWEILFKKFLFVIPKILQKQKYRVTYYYIKENTNRQNSFHSNFIFAIFNSLKLFQSSLFLRDLEFFLYLLCFLSFPFLDFDLLSSLSGPPTRKSLNLMFKFFGKLNTCLESFHYSISAASSSS